MESTPVLFFAMCACVHVYVVDMAYILNYVCYSVCFRGFFFSFEVMTARCLLVKEGCRKGT